MAQSGSFIHVHVRNDSIEGKGSLLYHTHTNQCAPTNRYKQVEGPTCKVQTCNSMYMHLHYKKHSFDSNDTSLASSSRIRDLTSSATHADINYIRKAYAVQ